MSEGGEVSLALIGTLLKDLQPEQRQQSKVLHQLQVILLGQVEQIRRMDRRLTDVKDDLELMIRAELMGRLGHFETRIDERIDRLVESIGTGETPARPSTQ